MCLPVGHQPVALDLVFEAAQGPVADFKAFAGGDVEGPVVFGTGQAAVHQGQVGDVGLLVGAAGVIDAEVVAGAIDVEETAIGLDEGDLALGQVGDSGQVVPFRFGVQIFRTEFG